MTVPAGWYPDPSLPGSLRYHDGTAWTAHTAARTAPEPSAAPAATGVPSPPLATARPAPGADRQVAVEAPAARSPVATLPPVVMPFGVDGPVAADTSPTVIAARVADAEAAPARRRWWIAGIAGAVVIAAAGAWALLADHGPSGVEAVQQSFAAQSASRVVDAEAAVPILQGFAAGAKPPLRWTLLPKDGATLGAATFAGLCGLPAAVDADRIARRQWLLRNGSEPQPLSLEVVAYRSVADAEAAVDTVRAAVDRCVKGVTTGTGARAVSSRASAVRAYTPPVVAAQGIAAVVVRRATVDGSPQVIHLVATIQQRGQFVSALWMLRPRTPTAAELAAVGAMAYQQSVRLAKTPLP